MKHYFQKSCTLILLLILILTACSKEVAVNVNNEASTQTDTNSSDEVYDLPDVTDKLEVGRQVITPKNVNDISVLKYYGTGNARDIAISPSGDSLAVTTARGVYIYSLPEFHEKYFFSVGDASKVIFSPDGKMISVSIYEGNRAYTPNVISVWDVTTETKLWNVHIDDYIVDFLFTPDTQMLAAVILDQDIGTEFINLWDSRNGKDLSSMIDSSGRLYKTNCITFSSDGSKFAFLDDSSFHILDLQTGKELSSVLLQHFFGEFEDCVLSPDLKYIAISQDKESQMSLWNVQTGEQVWVHFSEYSIDYLKFLPDGKLIVSIDKSNNIDFRDLTTGEMVQVLYEYDEDPKAYKIVFSSDGKFMVSLFETGIALWDIDRGKRISEWTEHDLGSSIGTMSSDSKLVATVYETGKVRVWDTNTATQLWETEPLADCTGGWDLEFSPLGKKLLVHYFCDLNDHFRLFESKNGTEINKIFEPYSPFFINDNLCDISDYKIRDLESGNVLFDLEYEFTNLYWPWVLSPDYKMIAGLSVPDSNDRELVSLILWNVKSGEILKVLDNGNDYSKLVFSPNGKILAGSTNNTSNTVVIWDTSSGEKLRTFLANYSIDDFNFFPDGQSLVIYTKGDRFKFIDGEFSLWNIKSGKLTCKFNDSASDSGLFTIFSPDGKILATYDYFNNLKLWDTSNCTLLRDMEIEVVSASFSDDGRFLITGDWDGLAKLWGIP